MICVPYIRVIDSPRSQIIIGADVLCGRRDLNRWNFYAIPIETSATGVVKGSIVFKRRNYYAKIPLINVPAIQGHLPPPSSASPAQSSMSSPAKQDRKVSFGAPRIREFNSSDPPAAVHEP